MGYIIGIDIGGTKCAVLLGAQQGGKDSRPVLMKKVLFETRRMGGPDEAIHRFIQTIQDMMDAYGVPQKEIVGIGISCGGPLDRREGLILNPPNLPGWVNVPICKMLGRRFGLPVVLENDANACALAEWKYGAGRGYSNVVFLTFGTGLGAGLILDGRLYHGTNDMAGEVGHIRLTECGPVGFGKMGSFEGYCSGGGISQIAQMKVLEQVERGMFPKLGEQESLDARQVAKAAQEGDTLARDIFAMSGRYLGKGLSILIDILNPEIIIIGSVFERNRDLLWPCAKEEIEKESLAASKAVCKVEPSMLGDQIGDYAALALVEEEYGADRDIPAVAGKISGAYSVQGRYLESL